MPRKYLLGDLYAKGPDGSGVEAGAIYPNGTLPEGIYPDGMIDSADLIASDLDATAQAAIRARLGVAPPPTARLLPDVSGLSASDDGDVLLVDGARWVRGGFEDGNQTKFLYDGATGNVKFDWQETRHQQAVFDSFTDGGWTASADAMVSTTNKSGATPHTLAELQALHYEATHRNPSPNAGAGFIGVRVSLARETEAEAGKFRVAMLSGDGRVGLNTALSDGTHIGDDNRYAYHSVPFVRFVSDEVMTPEELDPFELDRRYANPLTADEQRLLNAFNETVWENTATAQAAISPASTTPYGAHNNRIDAPTLTYAASVTVPAQANPFYVGFRIPIGRKASIARYRIEATPTGEDVHYNVVRQHVADGANHAYFLVRFGASAVAQVLQAQMLDEHHIDTDEVHINAHELHDVPDSYIGSEGKSFVIKGDHSGVEFADRVASVASTSDALSVGGTARAVTLTVDQTAFETLQLGAPESTHVFTFAQNGGDGVKQVPTQAFNIHPDNIIKVLVTIGNDWYPFSVPSAFLRLLGTTAKPTGVSANDRATSTTDKVVLDCDGRDILLMRAPDNTIITASPQAITATIRLYEVGGIAGRAGQQAIDSRAPRVDWFWRSVSGGATPTFAGQFDGVTWRNLGTWRRFPVTGSLGAGEAYWYARARSVYNPASTFDWNSTGVVYPAASARFSRSEFPTTPAHILSAPPTDGSDYYVQYYLGGGQWSPFSLVVGAPHGLDLIASSNWHPDSRTARIHWDTAFTRFDTLKGIHVELGLYNQFLDQFLESESFFFPAASLVSRARSVPPALPPPASVPGSNLQIHLQRYGASYGQITTLPTQDHGADNYSQGGFGLALEFASGTAGRTAFGFDRLVAYSPETYNAALRLRYAIKIRVERL